MALTVILGSLAVLSLLLLLWQWLVALRFPLHRRIQYPAPLPGVTLLKPLKGSDELTEACLRSWFAQEYTGPMQILFGVAAANDPACEIVKKLIAEFGRLDAQLIVCGPLAGTNAKVSKLVQLEKLAKHAFLVISDADVRVPPDLLSNIMAAFSPEAATHNTQHGTGSPIGLVNCFYSLANPSTEAMHWEAIAINADFWSQVLQAQSLKPLDFALGAVMAVNREHLQRIGGFDAIKNCLADDYQLGHRIAKNGGRIVLSTIPVQCFSGPMGWRAVWKHQLRWARTIRVSQSLPYFFSVLSNPTLWPLLWMILMPTPVSFSIGISCLLVRMLMALNLESRLTQRKSGWIYFWLVPIKDLLQAAIWAASFMGNSVEWRGEKMKLLPNGELSRS